MQNQFKSKILQIISLLVFAGLFIGWSKINNFSSGRTDRLKGAPFYKNYSKKIALQGASIGYLPVGIDKTTRGEFYFSGREKMLLPIAEAINAYIDSTTGNKFTAIVAMPDKGSPSVYIGSSEGEGTPPAAAEMRVEHDKYPPMIIHIENASKEWRQALKAEAQTQYVLSINIGFVHYPKADKGIFGKKVILGTGYEHKIRFLSAIDKPVEVLQISGMLLDREGNILRVGAEGMFHEDSPFWAQVLEMQKSMDDNTLRRILEEERREDLPDRPLIWQAALKTLLEQILSH